jgi:hypothetical protein
MAIETIKELASISKGHNRFIRLSVVRVDEQPVLDVRQWVESEAYTGPDGKKGVMIHAEALNQIIEEDLLTQAKTAMEEVE